MVNILGDVNKYGNIYFLIKIMLKKTNKNI